MKNLIKFIFIFIFLACPLYGQEKLYIALDNKLPSKILKLELTRDWTSGKMLSDTHYALDNIRIELQNKIVFVEYKDKEFPDLDKYPAYKSQAWVSYRPFPERACTNSSWPLLTTEVLYLQINSKGVRVEDWQRECFYIQESNRVKYVEKVCEWMIKNYPDDVNSGPVDAYGGGADPTQIKKWKDKYSSITNFPKFETPVYPICPLKNFPWEPELIRVWK